MIGFDWNLLIVPCLFTVGVVLLGAIVTTWENRGVKA